MNEPKLGERELDIMQALWDRGEGTVGDVHQTLVAMGRLTPVTRLAIMGGVTLGLLPATFYVMLFLGMGL